MHIKATFRIFLFLSFIIICLLLINYIIDGKVENAIVEKFKWFYKTNKTSNFGTPHSKCGLRKSIQNKVTFLEEQGNEDMDWPWFVKILRKSSNDKSNFCGGTLISSKTVLTAGQCVAESGMEVHPDVLVVTIGNEVFLNDDQKHEQKVNDVILHPDFNHKTLDNNLALLDLLESVTNGLTIQPICLWQIDDYSRNSLEGKTGIHIAKGHHEGELNNQQLVRGLMKSVPDFECIRSSPAILDVYLHKTSFCAGYSNGKNICNAVIGGGIFYPETTDTDETMWYLRGIASLSVSMNKSCDTAEYVVFTDIVDYLPWIEDYYTNEYF